MKTAIILEDEIIAANRLSRMISEVDPNIQIIEIFDTIADMANYFNDATEQPDMVFMDIQVADGNSFELFEIVNIQSKVIFTTAYDDFAVKAFRKQATDYLLKPVKINELKDAIQRATKYDASEKPIAASEGFKKRFLLHFGSKFQSIPTNEIAYVLSRDKISFFYTFSGHRAPSNYNLQEIESMLDPKYFFRINRQFIIHLNAVKAMKTYSASRLKIELTPSYNEEIVISTEKAKLFKKWLDR